MRVTGNTSSASLIEQLNRLASRQNRLQLQVSTGQRVQLPEDDPAAMRLALELQSEARTVAQFRNNIALEQDRADTVYSTLKGLKKVSDRAGEIATLADGTRSPQELNAYASEITQLLKQAVQVANSKQNGNYLFAGTRTDQPPFSLVTDASGKVTGVTYQGNQDLPSTEIGQGVSITAQVIGANTTGTGSRGLITDNAAGADFFNHLISLRDHLLAGDTTAIAATDRSGLTSDEDNLLFNITQNGAVQARLDASASFLTDRATSLDHQISQQTDADLAQTLVQLNSNQTAYQAALQSGAKLFDLSLLDFIR